MGRRHTVLRLFRVIVCGFLSGLALFKRFQSLNYFIVLPLSPGEVVIAVVVEVAHRPPEPLLEARSDYLRVISLFEEVLIWREGSDRKACRVTVGLIYFGQKCPIVPLFQIEILVSVLWVRQIFRQLLDLSIQALKSIVRWLDLFLLDELTSLGWFCQNTAALGQRWLFVIGLACHQENFIVHASLDNQQACRDERFFEKLGLEHLNQVIYAKLVSLLCDPHLALFSGKIVLLGLNVLLT